MELLETLPNGREIFSRPKNNIKLEKQQAIKLHNAWKQSGKEFKPIFQDTNGELWEIEGGGNTFKTAKNPEGYRFGNWLKHFKRGVIRRGIERDATPNITEVAAAIKSRFPGLSKTDNLNFAQALVTLNDQELTKILASKKTGDHSDHMIPLAKGGLNWFKNFANIDAPTNLAKSDKLMSPKQIKTLALSLDRQEMILSGLSSDIVKDNPKTNFKPNLIKEIFKPNTPSANKLTGYTKTKIGGSVLGAANIIDLLIPGDASTQELRSVVQDGGSFKDAMKTYASEKKGEVTSIAATAPVFMAASKLPFVAPALKVVAPAFALTALVSAADKADDIFLDGKYKEFANKYGSAINEGKALTSIPDDFDYYKRGQI